nr:AAA family ATPase [Candidatus Woesearchaeota archaeon]
MKITKVLIKNYRSIKKLEINFKNLFGLIGANSAGKSNILRAINFVLGERYPMPYSLSSKDFFNEDISNNITIEIHFDEKFASYNTECKGIIFQTTYDAGTNSFGAELKAIECSTNQSQRYRLRGDTKEQFPIVFIPATRNFEYHLQSSAEWSFLGKIIKQFNEIFPAEKISGLNSKFDEVKSQLETEKFKEFEKTFKDAFNEHVLPTQNEIDIGFKAFDPKSYYKTIEIIPKEYGDIRNIDQMGEGMKNLIFIALFRAYAKSFPKSTIFLIEEPELYLHPQGRADLFNIFKTLSEGGSQIIYSTHSQEFIDIERFSSIGLVNKIKDGDEYCTRLIQIEESAFLEKWKQQTGVVSATTESIKLFLKNVSDAETNKAFFANKIVFVEGTTEKWLLPIYALKEKVELEKNNIEILNT